MDIIFHGVDEITKSVNFKNNISKNNKFSRNCHTDNDSHNHSDNNSDNNSDNSDTETESSDDEILKELLLTNTSPESITSKKTTNTSSANTSPESITSKTKQKTSMDNFKGKNTVRNIVSHRFEIKQNGTIKQNSPSSILIASQIKKLLYNDLAELYDFPKI